MISGSNCGVLHILLTDLTNDTLFIGTLPINTQPFFAIFHFSSHSLISFFFYLSFVLRVKLRCYGNISDLSYTSSKVTFVVVVTRLVRMVKDGCHISTCISDLFGCLDLRLFQSISTFSCSAILFSQNFLRMSEGSDKHSPPSTSTFFYHKFSFRRQRFCNN